MVVEGGVSGGRGWSCECGMVGQILGRKWRAPILHCVTLHSVGGLSVDLKRDRNGEVGFCISGSVKLFADMYGSWTALQALVLWS